MCVCVCNGNTSIIVLTPFHQTQSLKHTLVRQCISRLQNQQLKSEGGNQARGGISSSVADCMLLGRSNTLGLQCQQTGLLSVTILDKTMLCLPDVNLKEKSPCKIVARLQFIAIEISYKGHNIVILGWMQVAEANLEWKHFVFLL